MDVSIVIPAYNEEKYIGNVLEILKTNKFVKEIIVVNDGSNDNTSIISRHYPVKVIDLPQNMGKGGAMFVGVKMSVSKNILFLDADLINLQESHINDLIKPVVNGEVDMTIGIFENGRFSTDIAQIVAPFLSGQRCLSKDLFFKIDNVEITRFGVEVALTRYAHEHKLLVKEVLLPNLTHVMKEEKLGLLRGVCYRLKMYWEIAKNVKLGRL